MTFFSRNDRRATRSSSPKLTHRLQLETLEDRCLLSAGTLDPTFGSGGIVTTKLSTDSEDWGRAVGLQNDGKIVVAGTTDPQPGVYNSAFAVLRYNANGSVDSSFASGGKAIIDLDPKRLEGANAMAVDYSGTPATNPNYGKIYVAGYVGVYNLTFWPYRDYAFALLRFNSNGTLDTSFGGAKAKGKVITNFTSEHDGAQGVAVQPDGKIVVSGVSNGTSILVRYKADGTLDSTFGNKGKTNTAAGRGLILQADGKIVAFGSDSNGSVLARYNINGSPDNSFGTTGVVTTSAVTSRNGALQNVVQQPDGKLVAVGGTQLTADGRNYWAFARFQTNGALDTSFGPSVYNFDFETGQEGWDKSGLWHLSTRRGNDGNHSPVTSFYYGNEETGNYVTGDNFTSTRNAGTIASGSFVVAADASVSFNYFLQTEGFPGFDVAKLQVRAEGFTWHDVASLADSPTWVNANYSLAAFAGKTVQIRFSFDTVDGFNNSFEGWYVDDVRISVVKTGTSVAYSVDAEANAVAVDALGRFVAVGFHGNHFTVVRLTPDGSLDSTFGTGGKVETTISPYYDYASSVVIQPDGKIVAVGAATTGGPPDSASADYDFALARYLGDSTLLATSLPKHASSATITAADVQLVAEAIHRWQTTGADSSALMGIDVRVANLGGRILGMTAGHTIWLDDNAAGWGWFIDRTPWNDSEYVKPGNQGEQHRMDLLSALAHEIGHLLGQEHEDDGVMIDTLATGIRRMPGGETDWLTAVDVLFAETSPHKRRW